MKEKICGIPIAAIDIAVQFVCEAAAVFAIVRSEMLPAGYLVWVIAAFVILLLISAALLFPGVRKELSGPRFVRRICAFVFTLIICAFLIYISAALIKITNTINSITGVSSDAAEPVDDVTGTPFIVYVSGSDSANAALGSGDRSDVNILMAVNPNTNQVLLINTPRDIYLPNPAGGGEYDKLTHCGLYGIDNSIKALEGLYDLDINYFFKVNFSGFETFIDAIGGITVYVDTEFVSAVGSYTFTEGENVLDGARALAFARERLAFSGGDNERGKNQMKVITAVVEKITSDSAAVLSNYSEILGSLGGMLLTSFSSDEISDLVKFQLSEMPSWDIKTFAISGTSDYCVTYSAPGVNLYVTMPDEELLEQAEYLVDKILSGELITDEDVE